MTRYEELMTKALEELKNNDELFCDMVEELDSWNGFADGFRAYPMDELDELHSGMKLSEFLNQLTGDFNINDNYFYYTIYGLESCDYKEELYRDNVDEGELLDNIRDNFSNLDFWRHDDFKELLEEIEEAQEEANEE